jgi:hypothetical protein
MDTDKKVLYIRQTYREDDGSFLRLVEVMEPDGELPKIYDSSVKITGTRAVQYLLDENFAISEILVPIFANPKNAELYQNGALWIAAGWKREIEESLTYKLSQRRVIVDPDTTVDMEFEYIDHPKRLAVATTQDLHKRLLDEWEEIEELLSKIADGPHEFSNFYGDNVLLDSSLGMCNGETEEFEKAEAMERRLAVLDWTGFTLTSIGMMWPYRAWEGIYDHWLLIQPREDAPLLEHMLEVDKNSPDLKAVISFLQERVDIHENS